MREQMLSLLEQTGVIAIVRGLAPKDALAVAEALYAGGIRLMEFTYEQTKSESWEETAETVGRVQRSMEGRMCIGAGTVTTEKLVDLTAEHGGSFIVSPDVNPDVICRTKELGLVSVPGALTPTEVMQAHFAGADYVKLFPACTMGADYIRLLHAPLSQVKLLAVGGITSENVAGFLRAGAVGAGVGGELVKKAWVEAGEFFRITEAARRLLTAMGR